VRRRSDEDEVDGGGRQQHSGRVRLVGTFPRGFLEDTVDDGGQLGGFADEGRVGRVEADDAHVVLAGEFFLGFDGDGLVLVWERERERKG
jgi:hypothetical protein